MPLQRGGWAFVCASATGVAGCLLGAGAEAVKAEALLAHSKVGPARHGRWTLQSRLNPR
jgi:hypothetical protein